LTPLDALPELDTGHVSIIGFATGCRLKGCRQLENVMRLLFVLIAAASSHGFSAEAQPPRSR
jgi:hypothetical protein